MNLRVTPLNERARAYYADCAEETLTEQQFVRSLLMLRKSVLTAQDEAAISALNGTVSARNNL